MPQFEVVEDMRHVSPGQVGTLIPSWNTGFTLRRGRRPEDPTADVVRPGQRLLVLEESEGHLKVRHETDGFEGWIPVHIVAPWPE
jgi:hypothetical protein